MGPGILLVDPLMPALEAELDAGYDVRRLYQATDRDAFIASLGEAVRGVVTDGGSGIRKPAMDMLPALEIVAINGVGTDAVDLLHAKDKGIRVTNTPDVLTDDVADLAMALMLAASRQLLTADRFVRDGRWALRHPVPLTRKVSGKRLGIVGLGRIGRAVARRAEGFGMAVSYHSRRPAGDVGYPYVADLVALAAGSDVLVVAASGGAGSRGIVNRAVMDALGPDGLLVNVARGTVVDEAALVAALTDRTLGGAGLDVFEDEPNVPPALLKMEHVVLQPHRASATVETRMAMGRLVLENLRAHFAGEALRTPVV